MKVFNYKFHFVNGSSIVLGSKEDIDFHKLLNAPIAFDDKYINMQNVTYIEKEVITSE